MEDEDSIPDGYWGRDEGEPCPECQSLATYHDVYFQFWKCEDCGVVWDAIYNVEVKEENNG